MMRATINLDSLAQRDPATLDFSMLTDDDLINIVLQRSDVLQGEPRPGDMIRKWIDGDPTRLRAAVADKGPIFAQRAAAMIQAEFDALTPILDDLAPTKIADIGCGYGMFDLFAYDRYGSDLLLIDVEGNEHRHFGFEEEASAYTSLDTARAFLTANGVPDLRVATWNPEADEPDASEKPDLAVSFLACGFHFPVDMYLPFFRFGVAAGGAVILDLRAREYQDTKRALSQLGRLEDISRDKGRRRVILRKGRR